MILWHCNFQIPDSTVQLADAFVEVLDFVNTDGNSKVDIRIHDGTYTVKEYTKEYNRTFNNVNEIYSFLLTEFENSEIV